MTTAKEDSGRRRLQGRFFDILAKLGEWLEDDGNGAISVTTHAGLLVKIQIRNKAPAWPIQWRLIQLHRLPEVRTVPKDRDRIDRYLLKHGFLTKTAKGHFRVTRKGRIAAERFDQVEISKRLKKQFFEAVTGGTR